MALGSQERRWRTLNRVRLMTNKQIMLLWLSLYIVVIVNHQSSSTRWMTSALPVQMVVNPRTSDCLYEELNAGEAITMSIIVLAGAELSADMSLEGPFPIATPPTEGENEPKSVVAALQESIKDWEENQNRDKGNVDIISFSRHIDFEHLNLGPETEDEIEDRTAGDDDKGNNNASEESPEQRRDRRAKERKKALEARQKREKRKVEQRDKVRSEGEPILKTIRVSRAGWYRYCVQGNYVTVEIDLRKESELGLHESGHVKTYSQMIMSQEEKFMEEDTAAEEGIKDEDFAATRDKLKALRRLLAEIQSKQTQERHRLIVHAATNEHSHSRMVLSSLFETVLFMAVTGFQVYTIRKWFRGAPVLGR